MPYDPDMLQEILLKDDCRTIDENGKALAPKHPVYLAISKAMQDRGCEIDPRHIHTIVNNDRRGFKTLLIKKYQVRPFKKADKSDNAFDGSSSKYTISDTSEASGSKTFKLVLSARQWLQLTPPRKLVSDGRVYWKFKIGWTDVIADRIYQQHDSLLCCFTFKNNLVNQSGNAKNYASFNGVCVECNATINGHVQSEPGKDTDVSIVCRVDDIVPELHTGTKKRPVRGEKRQALGNKLIEQRMDAATYRREQAKNIKKFGKREPSTLPKAATIRKIKEQQLLKIHGLVFANPVLELVHQSKFGKHAGSIHAVNALKFSCYYWTPEQFQLYVARCKKDPNAVLTIDATGGIVEKDKEGDPHVFLYQCMLVTTEGSVPVFQGISTDQSAMQIGNLFRLILAKGAPILPVTVSDFGWAILIASAQNFGKCTDLKDYLQRCYDVVKNHSDRLPASYIRLDVAHLIAMVSRWKSLEGKGKNCAVRRFYLKCMGQAYQISKIEELTKFLLSILIVSLSQYIGCTASGRKLPSESPLQYINKIIKGCDIEEPRRQRGESSEDGTIDTKAQNLIDTSWTTWTQTLFYTAQEIGRKSSEGSVINACHNPAFAKQFKKQLMPYVPLWTGVMRPFFKVGSVIASSATVEAEFSDLKTRGFGSRLPIRADKFVVQHLDYLDGKLRLASNPSDLVSIHDDEPNEIDSSLRDGTNPTTKSPNSMGSFLSGKIKHSTPKETLTEDARIGQETDDSKVNRDSNTNKTSTLGANLLTDLGVFNTLADLSTNSSPGVRSICNLGDSDLPEFPQAIKHVSSETAKDELDSNTVKTPTLGANRLTSPGDTLQDSLEISSLGARSICNLYDSDLSEFPQAIKDVSIESERHLIDLNICEPWRGLGEEAKSVKEPTEKEPHAKKRKRPTHLDKSIERDIVGDAEMGAIPMSRNSFLDRPKPVKKPIEKEPSAKKHKQPTYLDKSPEWDYVKDAKMGAMPMFRNGFLDEPIEVEAGKPKVKVVRTCAFDAAFQIIGNAMATNPKYLDDIKLAESPIIALAFSLLHEKKITYKHLQDRIAILLKVEIFRDAITESRYTKKLDAKCNVSHLVDYLLEGVPSYTKSPCPSCGHKVTPRTILLNVNVDILLMDGFQHMQRAIDDAQIINDTCPKCKSGMREGRIYGPHIMIDVSVFTDPMYPVQKPKTMRYTLDSIATTIELGRNVYMIAGVVHYQNEHYVGYAKSGVYWHKYDDLYPKRTSASSNTVMKPHLFVYTIVQKK